MSAQNPSFPTPSPQPIPFPPASPPATPPYTPDPLDPVLIPGIEDEETDDGVNRWEGIPSNDRKQLKITTEAEVIKRLSTLEDKVSKQEQTIKELKNRETLDGLPTGSIIFYDRENCAKGWSKVSEAKGRVLVGAGLYNIKTDEDRNNQPYSYELKATGGNMDFILTEQQMPKHQHGTAWGESFEPGGKHGNVGNQKNHRGSNATDDDNYEYLSEPKGDGQPFDNRMPYIAYTVCKKDE